MPESIRAVAARCRARACASRSGLLLVVVLRGEDVSAHAREASVPENGGVDVLMSAPAQEAQLPKCGGATESGGGALTLEQSLDHASRGKGSDRMGDSEKGPGDRRV